MAGPVSVEGARKRIEEYRQLEESFKLRVKEFRKDLEETDNELSKRIWQRLFISDLRFADLIERECEDLLKVLPEE